MGDLIDFINRHAWVILVFFIALFAITYGISRSMDIDRTQNDNSKEEMADREQQEEDIEDSSTKEAFDEGAGKETTEPEPTPVPQEKGVIYQDAKKKNVITLRFGGDINLGDKSSVVQFAASQKNGITDSFGKKLKVLMETADIMMLNHEYACSNTGEPAAGKTDTFLAKDKNNKALKKLGVDIVSLANHHVYDYGKKAFRNTLKSLEKRDIAYVGAGKDEKEAAKPVYYNINGVKLAFVSATCAEENVTPSPAGADAPGVFYTDDDTEFLKVIRKAKKKSDYVIAYVHWGKEYSTRLETEQTTRTHGYIDAGADLVVGSHSHLLQGMEYYKGKPVIYNLGNYLFDDQTLDTGLLEVKIATAGRKDTAVKKNGAKVKYGGVKNKNVTVKFYPCIQAGNRTVLPPLEEQAEQILQKVADISVNTRFTKKGILKKTDE